MRLRVLWLGVMVAVATASCASSAPDVTAGPSLALPAGASLEDGSAPVTTDLATDQFPTIEQLDTADLNVDLGVLSLDEIDLPAGSIDRSPLNGAVSVAEVRSYGYSITYFYGGAGDDGGDVKLEVDGLVDRVDGRGQWRIKASGLASAGDALTVHPDVADVVWIQEAANNRQAVYGLVDGSGQTGPPVWFDIGDSSNEAAQIFMPEATLTIDELWAILPIEPLAVYDIDAGLTRAVAEFVPDELLSASDGSAIDTMNQSSVPVSLIVDYDVRGLVRDLVLHGSVDGASSTAESHELIFSLSMVYPGNVTAMFEVVDLQPWVDSGRLVFEDPEPPGPAFSDRLVVEMAIIGSWASDVERIVSVDADGRVTIVTDRSVLSSTEDFMFMTLTPRGHQRLAKRLEATGVFDLAGQLPRDSGRVGPDEAYAKMTIDGFDVFTVNEYRADYPSVDPARRAALDAVAVVSDLAWLEPADIQVPVGPWIPDTMQVSARAGVAPGGRGPSLPAVVADWPYAASISEMADGPGSNAYDEPTLELCLRGDDVEALFSMLDGRNHAYLPVMNEGSVWELNVEPMIPGSARSAC